MRHAKLFVVGVAVAACQPTTTWEPYYENESNPTVSAIDPASELGNAGGQVVTITGSGFGDDPANIVVQFQRHNAEIVSVTDSAIEVVTPRGPITGGPVDFMVATETGYTECVPPGASGYRPDCELSYTYDMSELTQDTDLYTGQQHYIQVHNLWYSCYGGMYDNPQIGGCDTIAYFGQTGVDGVGEFFNFSYPRLHSASQGFVSGSDVNAEWRVIEQFDQPFPSGIDELRRRVGDFKLVNEFSLGETYCVDLALPIEAGEARTCQGTDIERYDLGELQFCEETEGDSGRTRRYRADWPVQHNFFLGEDGDFAPAEVLLDLTDSGAELDLGLSEYPITVPPSISVHADVGFTDADVWAVSNMADCGDSDGDGEAYLDEDGVVFSWEPIPTDVLDPDGDGDRIEAIGSYVHVSVSLLNVGWFLGDGWGLRASVVVPDDNDFDSGTGRSSVGIPNSVLYQFPTPNASWSTESVPLGFGSLGTVEDNASFMLIEIHRITDYAIQTDRGKLVFSYLTGDMTFPDWSHPLESGADCGDCLDADGDGWTDFRDPDCNDDLGGTEVEENATSEFSCNDGLDNDGDGDIDSEDVKCEVGWDAESNCDDGIDNDGDGWADTLDGECTAGDPFAQEVGEDDAAWTCSDLTDNDGDGWTDALDPACTAGDDTEDDGELGNACNDGDDNDGDGYIDAEDLYCFVAGATADIEAPVLYSGLCIDSGDNDSDGFVDAFDPDCELPPHSNENRTFLDPAEYPVPECYDGLDNDADGLVDADDPHCWNSNADFAPDGFLPSESVLRSDQDDTGCNDGDDGDSDGWIDGLDPDCLPNQTTQEEVGFGTTACNDGIDNNDDGLTDSESPYCDDGWGTFEGP